jgi:hypothetical protein
VFQHNEETQDPLQHQEQPSSGGSKKAVGNKNLLVSNSINSLNFKLYATSILAQQFQEMEQE